MFGPPGTGKTMMARACAGQTKATFLKLAGTSLVQMYIGDGPKMVRDAFALAKAKAPTIIFIDEIDAVGTKRFDNDKSGDREVQRTMIELLNHLDGYFFIYSVSPPMMISKSFVLQTDLMFWIQLWWDLEDWTGKLNSHTLMRTLEYKSWRSIPGKWNTKKSTLLNWLDPLTTLMEPCLKLSVLKLVCRPWEEEEPIWFTKTMLKVLPRSRPKRNLHSIIMPDFVSYLLKYFYNPTKKSAENFYLSVSWQISCFWSLTKYDALINRCKTTDVKSSYFEMYLINFHKIFCLEKY